MKTLLVSLRGFLGVNLLLAAPVVLLLRDLPRFAEVVVETPNAISIGIGKDSPERVRECPGRLGDQKVQINLTCDYDLKDVNVFLSGNLESACVKKVSVARNLILKQEYVLDRKGDCCLCTPVGGLHLAIPERFVWMLLLCEVGFFACSFGAAFYVRKKMSPRRGWIDSAIVASLASVFVVLVVPLQSYLANRSLFPFSMGEFLSQAALITIIAGALLFVGLKMSERPFGRFSHLALLAFVAYEYLECGVLSLGEPPINGELVYYINSLQRKFWDTVCLGVIFVTFLFLYRWTKGLLRWIALILTIMIGASLLDVKQEVRQGEADVVGFCSKVEAVKTTRYSAKRNVIVLILDACTSEVMDDILDHEPDLREKFTGFVSYRNMTGMHVNTVYSVPAIMTGKYYADFDDMAKYQAFSAAVYSQDSFIAPYLTTNSFVRLVPGSSTHGFAYPHIQDASAEKHGEASGLCYDRRPSVMPILTLYEMVRLRLTPFRFKATVLAATFVGTAMHGGVENEVVLCSILKDRPIDESLDTALLLYHTMGGHPPFDVDRNGNRLSTTKSGYDGYYDKAYAALYNVGMFFDALRENGVYDKSCILIISDHGLPVTKRQVAQGEVPHNAFPMFWAKAFRAEGPIAHDQDTPVAQPRIYDLVVALLNKDLSSSEITALMRQSPRVFRKATKSKECEDWLINDDRSSRKLNRGESVAGIKSY